MSFTKSQTLIKIPRPEYLGGDNWQLEDLAYLNIIFGKNGSGKSTLLRAIANANHSNSLYVPPERGGLLNFRADFSQSLKGKNRETWDRNQRKNNQLSTFKELIATKWSGFLLAVLFRAVDENIKPGPIIKQKIEELNKILPELIITTSSEKELEFKSKKTGKSIGADLISSGESEAIALGIESLLYAFENEKSEEIKYLLLDEPDLHLHPELQANLANYFLRISRANLRIIIATHSTAILSALAEKKNVGIWWLSDNPVIKFSPISEVIVRLSALFEGHPLASIVKSNPLLLIEGASDIRVWQKAKASSESRLRFYFCDCGGKGKGKMNEYEKSLDMILSVLLDIPKSKMCFSLRDKDDSSENNNQRFRYVRRLKLECKKIENCYLSNEVLTKFGSTWPDLKVKIRDWLKSEESKNHKFRGQLEELIRVKDNRKNAEIKEGIKVLVGILDIHKKIPWEDVVGGTIGTIVKNKEIKFNKGSMCDFLGKEVVEKLLDVQN